MQYVLAIDQGTSSTKTLLFDEEGRAVSRGIATLKTSYDPGGFVEQDAEAIIANVLQSLGQCLSGFTNAGGALENIIAAGISNQRETFLVWDKGGRPLHPAIVWQCKRSVSICERWKAAGYDELIHEKTGLLIDPYFSGSKLVWLNENVAGVRDAIERGEAFFGTVDTWLLYRFTKGRSYFTDHTNASRTLLFNLHTLEWDRELLDLFGLSKINLPSILSSSDNFGTSDFEGLLPKEVAITGMIGDSHAAAFGEGCFIPGTAKTTLGTGCSILMNVGPRPALSGNGMVSTICWSTEHQLHYALEGVIVSCGATIEWLKNELGLFQHSRETESMARLVDDNGGVYLVPAFSGLGAPHWEMSRRATISGLSFGSSKNHIVRAALESIAYQIADVIGAMEEDTKTELQQLMVDGGISSNSFVLQFLADLLNKPVVNIGQADVSALGAAYMAGLKSGVYSGLEQLSQFNGGLTIYYPSHSDKMKEWYDGWKQVVRPELDK